MKNIMILLALVVLMGCGKQTSEVSSNYNLPEELKDCKIYHIDYGLSGLYVVRCPMSYTTVTYRCGKTNCTAATVEIDTTGLGEYTRLKKKFNK